MERNADDLAGASASGMGASGSTGGFGSSGDVSGSSGYAASGGATAGATSTESGALTDRAKSVAGSAKDKLASVGSTVREQAGTAKDKLADALESGADKLRQRSASSQLAGSTGTTDVAVSGETRMTHVTDRVAGGMQATADWLRDADLDSLRTGVERQVKEHPGRTLLIAVGLGYLLGKAFRK
jgi:hypothetical protein